MLLGSQFYNHKIIIELDVSILMSKNVRQVVRQVYANTDKCFFFQRSRIVKGRDDHGSECCVLVAKETSLAAIYGKESENRAFKYSRSER